VALAEVRSVEESLQGCRGRVETVDDVFLDVTPDELADGPGYAPQRITERDYLERVYGHYERTPCWESGYVFPEFNR